MNTIKTVESILLHTPSYLMLTGPNQYSLFGIDGSDYEINVGTKEVEKHILDYSGIVHKAMRMPGSGNEKIDVVYYVDHRKAMKKLSGDRKDLWHPKAEAFPTEKDLLITAHGDISKKEKSKFLSRMIPATEKRLQVDDEAFFAGKFEDYFLVPYLNEVDGYSIVRWAMQSMDRSNRKTAVRFSSFEEAVEELFDYAANN